MNDSNPENDKIAPGWIVKVIVLLLWFVLVVGGYFWAHKPFDVGLVASVGQVLLNIVGWLGLTWLGAALGLRLAGGILAEEGPATRLSLAAGLGLGLIAVVMGIVGLLGWIRPLTAWLLIILLTILLRRPLRAALTDLKAIRRPRPADNFQRWLLIYGSASLLLTFIVTLAPIIAWDSLTYHLTGPKFYIEAGRFVHPVNIPHLGFPLVGQMQYMLGMLLVGDGVAPLLHFGYGLFTLALTVDLARRAFGVEAAWLAGTVLLAIPTLFTLMSWPYVDVMLMFYATAAFYAFYRWLDKREGYRWPALIGFYCGFAGGVKYTAVAIPIALAVSLTWVSRRDGWPAILKRLAPIAVIAGVLVLPWLIENWVTTGNPVYPFFFTDALYWDEWRAWWYDRPGTGYLATAPWRLLLVPLEATIAGTEGSNFYEATVGPFILSLILLLPLVWRSFKREEKGLLGHMLLFFGVNYFLWLNGVARTALLLRARFLFLVFGVAAVIGGVVLQRLQTLSRPQLDVGWLVKTFVNLTLGLLLITAVVSFIQVDPIPTVIGLEPAQEYRVRQLGVYPLVIERINELPEDARVVFLWETRSYDCEVVCDPDPILDRFLHLTQHYEYDAADIAAQWQAAGFTHVLLYDGGLTFLLEQGFDPITADDLAVLSGLQSDYLAEVENWPDAYTLYELTP